MQQDYPKSNTKTWISSIIRVHNLNSSNYFKKGYIDNQRINYWIF